MSSRKVEKYVNLKKLKIEEQFIFIFAQKIWDVRYKEANLAWNFHPVPKICVRYSNWSAIKVSAI